MGRYIWLAIGALGVSVLIIAAQLGQRAELAHRSSDLKAEQSIDNDGAVPATSVAAQEAPIPAKSVEAAPTSSAEAADPRFRQWIASEARNLDSPHINAEKKQEEIKQVIHQLTPTQSRQLLATARDPKAPAGEKILSTYLLVEGGTLSRGELTALIASPLGDHGPADAHSEAEMVGVREKSLRIMAIDGLFSRAQKDASAREALAKVIEDIQDPYVRDYARDRYARLKAQ